MIELEIGNPAHGGHCVARHEGRVVFVRHTLPGELVRARVLDERSKFWRAEAVEVLRASADRVPSVWPEAGPGGVGGGELAHVALPAQRAWKEHVVRDSLRRIGGEELAAQVEAALGGPVRVEALPGDDDAGGLGTRTRIELTVDDARNAGMQRYRSHDVVALAQMPLAAPEITELGLLGAESRWRKAWRPGARVEAVAPSAGEPLVLVDGEPARPGGRRGAANARRTVRERVPSPLGELSYRVSGAGFWQVHRRAPEVLVEAVLGAARPQAGERVVELYAGAGLLSVPLATAVGESGSVVTIEGDARAVRDARRNLHGLPWADLREGAVEARSVAATERADVVVLDPPRAGAGRGVLAAVAALGPSRIVHVACDPAALARDLKVAADHGYAVTALRGLDLFPHTHHVEAVALLERR